MAERHGPPGARPARAPRLDELAETGRAVARLDGLGWSALRELFAATTPDGDTPVALRRAAARVLDDWAELYESAPQPDGETGADDAPGSGGPAERRLVDGVVAVRSATRPRLTFHLANGLASYLGKPLIGAVGPVPGREEPGRHDVNSATRLAGVAGRLQLELSDAARAVSPVAACCSSTTTPSRAGPSRSRRACCAAPGRRRCTRSCSGCADAVPSWDRARHQRRRSSVYVVSTKPSER